MTDVDTIKDPEREMQRFAERRQFFKPFANDHWDGIAAVRGHIKPNTRDG